MESKKPFIFTLLISLVIITILSYWIYSLSTAKKEKEDKIVVLQEYLQNESVITTKITRTKDSLLNRVNYLQKYSSLIDAVYFRDSTSKSLKFKAGDVVLLKPDSAKGVIKEIIIGGTQYEYYIKYKIVLRDRSQIEITPEMLY